MVSCYCNSISLLSSSNKSKQLHSQHLCRKYAVYTCKLLMICQGYFQLSITVQVDVYKYIISTCIDKLSLSIVHSGIMFVILYCTYIKQLTDIIVLGILFFSICLSYGYKIILMLTLTSSIVCVKTDALWCSHSVCLVFMHNVIKLQNPTDLATDTTVYPISQLQFTLYNYS